MRHHPLRLKYCIAFVLLGAFPRIEGAEVFPLAGLRIYFARIEPVLTGLQFSNHRLLRHTVCSICRKRGANWAAVMYRILVLPEAAQTEGTDRWKAGMRLA